MITPSLALFPWGDLIEDFLDSIDLTFEQFCTEMSGGWMFGYVESLKRVGVRSTLFCISNRVTSVERHLHQPTGATICVLPAPKLHTIPRRFMQNPYGWTVEDTFGKLDRFRRPVFHLLKDIAPYLATPLWSVATELKRENCRAILCQEYEYARFDACVLLGQWLNLPVYATFQGGDFQLSRLERFVRPATIQRCAGLIIATQTEIQRIQSRYEVPAAKVAQIFNPIDLENWQLYDRIDSRQRFGIPLDAEVVVCHGRIDIHRKGLDILLKAWQQVCTERSHRELRLLLVGTGRDADRFAQLIESQQNILWVNQYVRDRALIQQYLSASDLYVLASRHEGFPVAPIEAMASGLPIVATRAPGVADILGDPAKAGLIVPCDDPVALATAIGRLLDDQSLRQQFSQQARQRVEHCFSLTAIAQQLDRLMQLSVAIL
ncbi:putative glycosyl transferase [Leptolyngbya sp. NIES-3755]|nr:putative glycosyl transferase [Leptolyngbya sp. NIES-3755]